jgi:hypothetical protein
MSLYTNDNAWQPNICNGLQHWSVIPHYILYVLMKSHWISFSHPQPGTFSVLNSNDLFFIFKCILKYIKSCTFNVCPQKCVYTSYFLYPLISWWRSRWLHRLATAISMGVQVSSLYSYLHYFSYIPTSGIAGSFHSFFSVMRNSHSSFHNGCSNFHCYRKYTDFHYPCILTNIL